MEDVPNEPPPPTYVQLLAEIAGLQAEIQVRIRRLDMLAVRLVRETGTTWQAIADELGVTRQAVAQRFSGDDD